MRFAKGTILRHTDSGNEYESDGNGGWTSLRDGRYYEPGDWATEPLQDADVVANHYTIVKQPLGLKVGDRVRLTGTDWYGAGEEPAKGEVYTLTGTDNRGRPTFEAYDHQWFVGERGYEAELVEDNLAEGLRQSAAGEVESLGDFTRYADDEIREVSLETVVEDVNYLIECMRGLGFRRNEARRTIITSIGLAVPEGDK